MSVVDDLMAGAARYGDNAGALIRRLLGLGDSAPPPARGAWDDVGALPPQKGKPGGDVRSAVEANDAARAREAMQAQRIGLQPERPPVDPTAPPGPSDTLKTARDAMTAGGAVAGAGAVGAASQYMRKVPKPTAEEGITSTDGTAELANESRPAPTVAPSEDEEKAFTETFKRQYTARENKRKAKGAGTYPKPQEAPQQPDPREQAQALIADLNERRRKAGGEVADAQQTMAKINSLLAQSDKIRNSRTSQEAGSYAKANPNDYHAQASAMIADLNERAKAMGGTPPDMQQTLAEVRRLQALGDQQRNAAQTRRY